MLARISAFVVWSLVVAIAVFWGLRLLVRSPVAPSYTVAVGDAGAVRGDLARLLGTKPVALATTAAAPPASSRLRLLGVVASNGLLAGSAQTSKGVALIAVDGKMPKAYAVGARLDADMVLQGVGLRSASIASVPDGPPSFVLELPPLGTVATGRLPFGSSPGSAAPAMQRAVAPAPQYAAPAYKPYSPAPVVPGGPPPPAQ